MNNDVQNPFNYTEHQSNKEIMDFANYIVSALSNIKDATIIDDFCAKTLTALFEAKKKDRAELCKYT